MRLSLLVLIVCAAQVMLGSNSVLYSAVPSVEELERRAITYRLENTKQGYVRMFVTNDKPPLSEREYLYEITFDEHRIRQIRRYRQRGSSEWVEAEKIVVTPESYIADDKDTGVPVVVRMAPAKDLKSPREHFAILNVQALGMSPSGAEMLHVARVESLLNRSDRTAPEVRADVRGGMDTWRIDYEIKNRQQGGGPKVSLWIAPSQGYSVVSIEVRSDQDGHRYTTIIDSQMKQYPEKVVWYPYKLVKTMKKDDRILDHEVVTVEEARFGGPIDETAFTPAGLDLKPGRQVIDSTSGPPWLKVWDGKRTINPPNVKTASASASTSADAPVHRHRPSRRWLLWPLSAGLALLAIFYFWRGIRKRRSTSNPGA